MILNKNDIFNFNVDEIEIFWTFSNYRKLFEWVNDSNSDYIIFNEFTLKKTQRLKNYEFKVDFFKNNVPCFAFYIWKKLNSKITTRDYFIVYWSAFQLFELNEIIDFIDTYLLLDSVDLSKWKRNNTLKRFDLALDLKKNILEIVKNFTKLTQKWAKFYWESWKLETKYIWDKQIRNNKSLVIRLYDKIEDIKKKNKQMLYPDYLLEENITRIEIEFRQELLKEFKLNQLLDRSYIFNLFIKYIEKHTKIFEKLKTEDVDKLKRLNKKVNLDDLRYDQIVRNKYISAFLWYSKTLLKIWVCPVDILIRNLIISENTKKDLHLWINNNEFDVLDYIKWKDRKYINKLFAEIEKDKIIYWKNG